MSNICSGGSKRRTERMTPSLNDGISRRQRRECKLGIGKCGESCYGFFIDQLANILNKRKRLKRQAQIAAAKQ